MKLLVIVGLVLGALCAVNAAADMKDRFKEVGVACSKENGVSEEDVQKFHSGQLKAADVKDNMKCAMNCVMVKMGFMNDAGKFNADAFKAAFTNTEHLDKVAAALEKCKGMEGPNPCETSFLITSCMMKDKVEGL